ncbi:SMI1/KNR4 family protein [Paenibacillus sp. ACRSA]|uniref:SMI1/KNR4 family protein n=1 Tax=Paenibacillus sp. ACRSA TaxID=2918211 RepID=UPI001EF43EAF|nr:SMI1/KNR4 family protein [Paenibacillus sp. ACRSA]MCG7375396.1 SMI1/KNR4 family protein [Paenibacillus sp. ACRSA]
MYTSLIEKLEHTQVLRWFPNRQVQESWIVEVEQELGFTLPPSYRWWLLNYGVALLSGTGILTISPPEHREYADTDILYMYRLADEDAKREGKVELFVPDEDEIYYFDVRTADESGEYKVMRLDYLNGEPEVYADSFAAFLERLIDERTPR